MRADDRRRTWSASLRALAVRLFARDRGPVVFVARTTLFALGATMVLLFAPWVLGALDKPSPLAAETPMTILIGAIIVGPVVENLLLIGAIETLRALRTSSLGIVAVVATLSGVAHAVVGTWQVAAGVVLFAVMASSYLVHRDVPFGRRYALLLAQHALFNLPAAIGIAID
jgi:hypothetical protein